MQNHQSSKAQPIKAVAMVRAIRDRHYDLLKNKSREEQMAFYREKAAKLHKELQAH